MEHRMIVDETPETDLESAKPWSGYEDSGMFIRDNNGKTVATARVADRRRVIAAVNATRHFTVEGLEMLCRDDQALRLPILMSVLMTDGKSSIPVHRTRLLAMVELIIAARQVLEENVARSSPALISLDKASEKLEAAL